MPVTPSVPCIGRGDYAATSGHKGNFTCEGCGVSVGDCCFHEFNGRGDDLEIDGSTYMAEQFCRHCWKAIERHAKGVA